MSKTPELTSEELRRSVSETLKRVAYAKEEFVITLYRKPVAKIVPIEEDEVRAPAARKKSP